MSRAIPSAPESERALLDMVLDRGSLILARTELAASAFYDPLIRETWAAAEAVWRAGGEVDISTVAAELHSRGRLEQVGGFSWLSSDRMSVVETLPHHLDRVRKAHSQRRLLLAFEDLGKRAFDMDPNELVGLAQAQLMEAVEDKGDPTRSLHAAALTSLKKKMLDRDQGPVDRLLTGWHEVDSIIGGLPMRLVTTLAGGTSHGKSSAARSIVMSLAASGIASHVFSMEDSDEAMADRAMSDYAGVNLQTLVNRPEQMQRGEWGRVVEACNRLKVEDRVLVDETPELSMERISMRVRKWKHSHKTKLVVVDYLQLLRDPRIRVGAPSWQKDNVDVAMLAAKRLAKEQDVAVLLLSQLGRKYAEEQRPPMKEDLVESGHIERESRCILAVYRPDRNTKDPQKAAQLRGQAIIRVLKAFNGPIGDADLRFDEQTATFRSLYQGGSR